MATSYREPQVRFFKVNPPQGFGFQRICSPDTNPDQAYVIRDNSLTKLPFGYHPTAAAPGCSLYYLWVLAGEPRNYILFEDPDHQWVKDV